MRIIPRRSHSCPYLACPIPFLSLSLRRVAFSHRSVSASHFLPLISHSLSLPRQYHRSLHHTFLLLSPHSHPHHSPFLLRPPPSLEQPAATSQSNPTILSSPVNYMASNDVEGFWMVSSFGMAFCVLFCWLFRGGGGGDRKGRNRKGEDRMGRNRIAK